MAKTDGNGVNNQLYPKLKRIMKRFRLSALTHLFKNIRLVAMSAINEPTGYPLAACAIQNAFDLFSIAETWCRSSRVSHKLFNQIPERSLVRRPTAVASVPECRQSCRPSGNSPDGSTAGPW